MMQQQTAATTMPRELHSAQAKLVYLYLSTHEEATLSELGANLDMTKLTLYSILRTLTARELVTHTDGHYTLS